MSKKSHWKIALYWFALFAWSGLIWYVSSRPTVPGPSTGTDVGNFLIRQGGHLVLHAVLALLAWRAAMLSWSNRIGLVVAWSLSIPHAILDELYQNRLPGRDANLEDVAYNLVGVVAALFMVWLWQRRKNGRRKEIS